MRRVVFQGRRAIVEFCRELGNAQAFRGEAMLGDITVSAGEQSYMLQSWRR